MGVTRVAVAGFQHETNSFVLEATHYGAFLQPDAWPGLLTGTGVLTDTAGCNLPTAGFVEEASRRGWQLVPLLWCSAGPSGIIARETYDSISCDILDRLAKALPVDAVYLDLHGAMVAEGAPDGDGELLRRVRGIVGPTVPIVTSLDFHANVSALMASMADALVLYRTYPHVDMAETGVRAAKRLAHIMQYGSPEMKFHQLPFLIPMSAQSTLDKPLAKVMTEITNIEKWGGTIEFAAGFPLADVPECGPTIISYGSCAGASSQRLTTVLYKVEHTLRQNLLSPDEAVTQLAAKGLTILVDTQDNPGCGGTGDTVGLLSALIKADIAGAILGVLCDPETSAQAHAAGVGVTIDVKLGGRHGYNETPLEVSAHVDAIGDGNFTGTGSFYKGCQFELGAMALLSIGKVKVVVATVRQQAADQAMFRHVGVDPAKASVLALKSTVHYRADFGALATKQVIVKSPGANIADLSELSFHALRPEMRIAGGERPTRITCSQA